MNILNRQCESQFFALTRQLTETYEIARPIINPTFCEKITLMCTLSAKVNNLKNKFSRVMDGAMKDVIL